MLNQTLKTNKLTTIVSIKKTPHIGESTKKIYNKRTKLNNQPNPFSDINKIDLYS